MPYLEVMEEEQAILLTFKERGRDAWGQKGGTAPRDLGEERQQGSQMGLDGDGDSLG